ncbi:MAG: transcription elongation factor GreA [Candidatus Andersenbacteria bacterium]|nr:transcription elongation factor GreA [bacterium]MDZ4225774.1 transcription elongation factor GreA [Candidatus Andersenbacteria bacterium]
MKDQYLTREGYDELESKLQNLKTTRRREIADAIHTAKEQGDLSENAEYVQAKEEQQRIEEQISDLETTLKHARVIANSDTTEVSLGNTVVVAWNGSKKEYRLVGSNEADPMQGKISNESPIGKALLGKTSGQEVEIPTPSGGKKCKVVEIR